MKLATMRTDDPDGALLIVSHDLTRVVSGASVAPTLRDALERWADVAARLQSLYMSLNDGGQPTAVTLDISKLAAPLPRVWQWLDGSSFLSHAKLMETAYGMEPVPTDRPLMYQGMSHIFLSGTDDVALPLESDGIDFEGELGVITDFVPMGISRTDSLKHIKLVTLINDWSLREVGRLEMKTGFGWVQGKPACSVAPIVMTPDELGPAWNEGKIDATLDVWLNDETFGSVPTTEMTFGFPELIAYAARTRDLCAGTIIGSGTVSASSYDRVGSCCIAERRAAEILTHGASQTPYMGFGDRVRMSLRIAGCAGATLGVIDQRVIKARFPNGADRQPQAMLR